MWARQLMTDPSARETYEHEAREKGKPILSLMISDYLQGPSAHDVGAGTTVENRESAISC